MLKKVAVLLTSIFLFACSTAPSHNAQLLDFMENDLSSPSPDIIPMQIQKISLKTDKTIKESTKPLTYKELKKAFKEIEKSTDKKESITSIEVALYNKKDKITEISSFTSEAYISEINMQNNTISKIKHDYVESDSLRVKVLVYDFTEDGYKINFDIKSIDLLSFKKVYLDEKNFIELPKTHEVNIKASILNTESEPQFFLYAKKSGEFTDLYILKIYSSKLTKIDENEENENEENEND